MRVIQPCPECGSTDLRLRRVPPVPGLLPVPWWGRVERAGELDVCVCAVCGFVRVFVPADLLPTVRDTYPPVPPADSLGDAA